MITETVFFVCLLLQYLVGESFSRLVVHLITVFSFSVTWLVRSFVSQSVKQLFSQLLLFVCLFVCLRMIAGRWDNISSLWTAY